MSYLTPTFLAADHTYRTERLARSWGGTLLNLSWVRTPIVRGRRSVPVTPVSPGRLGSATAATGAAGSASITEAAVTDYRERVLVGLR